MEWANLYEYPSIDNLVDVSPPPEFDQVKNAEWTFEENKIFENTLAEVGLNLSEFFETVALRVPTKSHSQIKKHFEDLVVDINKIDAGEVPLPDYVDDHQHADNLEAKKDQHQIGSSSHKRKRGVPWTEEEHSRFLAGLGKYGRGDWRNISRNCVVNKTPTQVASHAQKYYRRLNCSTPVERRRPSIHDIQAVSVSPIPPINPYHPRDQFMRHQNIPNPNYYNTQAYQTPAPNYVGLSLTPNPNGYDLNFGEGSSSNTQWLMNQQFTLPDPNNINYPSAGAATYAPPPAAYPSFNPTYPFLVNSHLSG